MTSDNSSGDWNSSALLEEAEKAAAETNDASLVQNCRTLINSIEGLPELLRADDPATVKRLRADWKYMAGVVKELLGKIEANYRERSDGLNKIRDKVASRVDAPASSSVSPPDAAAVKDARAHLDAVRNGTPGDIQTSVRHLAVLQAEATRQLQSVAHAVNTSLLETADALLRLMKVQINRRRRLLHRALWRMRLARGSRVSIRVFAGILSFLALCLLILLVHRPADEIAHDVAKGTLVAFGMLALLLLPVELIKAVFLEHRIQHWLRRRERVDTLHEFQSLITLAVRTAIEVSRVNAK